MRSSRSFSSKQSDQPGLHEPLYLEKNIYLLGETRMTQDNFFCMYDMCEYMHVCVLVLFMCKGSHMCVQAHVCMHGCACEELMLT